MEIEQTKLFDRIYAAMLGGAIGDAMGGPVEGRHYDEIEAEYGMVEGFLPYTHAPDYHNQFANAAGTVTDDTRLKHILCQAIINAGDLPARGDFARAVTEAYYQAESDLERGFLEEYMLAGLYGEERLVFAGQPTNGALMMNSPVGMVCAADPEAAFEAGFRLAYITDGYAKTSAAIMAAAVAAAFIPGIGVEAVIDMALEAARQFERTGAYTRGWQWYGHVFAINERLVETAVEIALREKDVLAVRPAFYEKLRVSELGSEAAQTLAVALGMFAAAGGDFHNTVIGAVNYGRDNDSYASIAGALAGAYHGTGAIPGEWIETVTAVNPVPDMRYLSVELARVALKRYERNKATVERLESLV